MKLTIRYIRFANGSIEIRRNSGGEIELRTSRRPPYPTGPLLHEQTEEIVGPGGFRVRAHVKGNYLLSVEPDPGIYFNNQRVR